MAANKRWKRNGTGPYKGSYQKKTVGVGRRQQAGKKCPKK